MATLSNSITNYSNIHNPTNNDSVITYGRVVEVINNQENPGMVKFAPIGISANDTTSLAFPMYPYNTYIPLLDEIILIYNGPSKNTADIKGATRNYYTVLSIYNNDHHNSLGQYNRVDNDILVGTYISESDNVKNIYGFEGDYIVKGRWGNTIRFGSTLNNLAPNNFWSSMGNEGDPILLLTNGLSNSVENINKDLSSIYLTSTQRISNYIDFVKVDQSPLALDTAINRYNNKSQIIINSNRVVLSSNKDSILLNAFNNINLSANNVISLNTKESIHLNSPLVILGQLPKNNTYINKIEPLVLGNKLQELLLDLLNGLMSFTTLLSSKEFNITTPIGTPMVSVIGASEQLHQELNILNNKIGKILSESTFTI